MVAIQTYNVEEVSNYAHFQFCFANCLYASHKLAQATRNNETLLIDLYVGIVDNWIESIGYSLKRLTDCEARALRVQVLDDFELFGDERALADITWEFKEATANYKHWARMNYATVS